MTELRPGHAGWRNVGAVKRSQLVFAATGVLIVVGAIFFRPPATADVPRLPHDDAEVIERLPLRASDPREPRERERARLHEILGTRPGDLRTGLALARLDIELSRARSDPRYLGYAQAEVHDGPRLCLTMTGRAARVARSVLKKFICIDHANSSSLVPRNPWSRSRFRAALAWLH